MLVFFRSLSLMPVLREEVPREETLLWDQLSPPWRKPSLPLGSPSPPPRPTPEYSSNSPIYQPMSPPPPPSLPSSPNLHLGPISPVFPMDRTTSVMVPSPPPTPPLPVLVDQTNFRAFRQRGRPHSKRQRLKMRSRTLIKDLVKEFGMDEGRVMLLEVMDSMGLTPGGPCASCLSGGWCSRSAICSGLMKARLS